MAFGRFRGDDNTASTLPSSAAAAAPIELRAVSSGTRPDVIIGKGTKIKGAVHFEGPSLVDGVIEGEIFSDNSLTIGEEAVITATIKGSEIIVRGTVTGDLVASSRIILKKPAKIVGNISTPALVVEEGVRFEGRCSMTEAAAKAVDATTRLVAQAGQATPTAAISATTTTLK